MNIKVLISMLNESDQMEIQKISEQIRCSIGLNQRLGVIAFALVAVELEEAIDRAAKEVQS